MHVHQESDGLNVCQVECLEDEARAEVPPPQAVLAELLRRALEQIGPAYGDVTPAYEDATWVGMRLAEILPLAAIERQEMLELNDGPERLHWLQTRMDIRNAGRRSGELIGLWLASAASCYDTRQSGDYGEPDQRRPADDAVIRADDARRASHGC